MCSFLAMHIKELNLAFLLAYRPPPKYDSENYRGVHLESSFNKIIIKNIENSISKLGTPTADIIIAGDFNFPKAVWSKGVGVPPRGGSSESRMLKALMALGDHHHLLQLIDFGTRPNPSGSSNPLDLIFTNNDQIFSQINYAPTSMSDHVVITCHTRYQVVCPTPNTNSPSPTSPQTLASFNMHKANWIPINQSINAADWKNEIKNRNVSDFSQFLLNTAINCLHPHCPKFKNKPGCTKNKIPRDRRILFRQRKRKKRLLNSLPLSHQRRLDITRNIIEIEKKLTLSYKNQNVIEEEFAIRNIKTNPKYFYSFARKKQITRGSIGL